MGGAVHEATIAHSCCDLYQQVVSKSIS